MQATDVVLVFTAEDGIKGLLKGKVKLGADASATAGPVGRKAEVGTDVLFRSGILHIHEVEVCLLVSRWTVQ